MKIWIKFLAVAALAAAGTVRGESDWVRFSDEWMLK